MPKLKYKEKSILNSILSSRIVVFTSNIIFQGMRYMSIGERLYKISISIIFTILLNLIFNNIIISFIVAHLLNYIFNGQYYVVFRYLSSKQVMSRKDLDEYLNLMKEEMTNKNIKDILIIGSFSRGKMSSTSDLDIRIYHNTNLIDSLKAYFFATKLRFYGLIMKFPIDVYCFSNLKFLDKIRKDENPVNFLKNDDYLRKNPKSVNIDLHMKTLELI